MAFSPPERELARTLITNLRSEKYKDRNYLFLAPFDLNQVPGYLDVVPVPLDLQTVADNLEQNQYDGMDAFMADLNQIFHNAIRYHAGRETKWIAGMAKEMLKVAQKEKSKLENPQKKRSIKLKLGKQLPKAGANDDDNNNNNNNDDDAMPSSAAALAGADAAEGEIDTTATPAEDGTTKKPKLKLKLSNSKKTPPPKAVKAKPTQPKLKLKLSLNKNKPTEPIDGTPSVASTDGIIPQSSSHSATEKKKVSKKEKNKDKKPPKETKDKKLSVKINTNTGVGGNRGKELPKGVVASATSTSKTVGTPTGTKTTSSTGTSKTSAPANETAKQRKTKLKKSPMSQTLQRQCFKVVLGLKRRQAKDISHFLNPVGKQILQDYKAKIKHPIDISKITSKLENGSYGSLPDFVLDLRRISANCLRYNTSMKDSIRQSAVNVLKTAEDLMSVFLTTPESPPYPRLLYCWTLCINVLDTLCNIVNPSDGHQLAYCFLHPVSFYFGGQFPPGYLDIIDKPMDFGTVVSNLLEGRYQSVAEFASDCRLIIQNTKTYYGDKEDGKVYVEQAERLDQVLSQQLDQLARYDKSSKAQLDKERAHQSETPVVTPPVPMLLSIMEEMRALKYTDSATKITEPAMGPFEKPVPVAVYPDYLQHVSEPMDLSTIDRRIKSGTYESPEDFEYDMTLTFRNCEIYNSKRNLDHFVKMAKYATRHFRRIFYAKIRPLEDPSAIQSVVAAEGGDALEPLAKKAKIEGTASMGGVSKDKIAPRITLSSAAVNAAARASNKSPRPPSAASQKKPGKPPTSNQPLPLHIAISRVKEAFPLRRAVKNLMAMEADLAKYLKDLMRHPWLSAARPKFIFHVPVTMLFPDLKDAYAAKIRKPMDLTTIECTLLAGNRYTSPDDFLQDIALTFSNAIKFNKDGRDIGDPASCAYYDASVHLLRYARWLSLEQLSAYVEDSDHVDDSGPDGLPPLQWRLTTANLEKAREELRSIVLEETIERSLEGDRWTWHEAECEKLLKALRHQSDNKHMKFFVHSDYPPNYTAYIAKPMDWERVQKKLRKRSYMKFGEIISDLRLIFENAKKYNGRFQDPTSQAAYFAAEHMAEKLEAAIRRMMISVADRIERERIDHANAEREEEAIELAEEAQSRATWEREHQGDGSAPPPTNVTGLQKIRIRKAVSRREDSDFEIPFFDDENEGQHERSYFEVIKFQKSMFEKQRQEMSKMRSMAAVIGGSFHARMLQRTFGQEWIEQERKKRGIRFGAANDSTEVDPDKERGENETEPSAVLGALEKEGRKQMKIQIAPLKKGLTKKRPTFSFNDE